MSDLPPNGQRPRAADLPDALEAPCAERAPLLISLSRLAARVQRERTVDGVLRVSGQGLCELGYSVLVMRAQSDGAWCFTDAFFRDHARATFEAIFGREALARREHPFDLPVSPSELFERGPRLLEGELLPHLQRRLERHGRPVPGDLPQQLDRAGLGAGMVSPLVVHGQPWGVLTILAELIPRDAAAALALFTSNVAASLEIAERMAELEAHNRRLEAIQRVASVGTSQSPEELIPRLFEVVVGASAADTGAIFLLDEPRQWLQLTSTVGSTDELNQHTRRIPLHGSVTGSIILEGRPRQVAVEEWTEPFRSIVRRANHRISLILPLVVDGEPIGSLHLSRFRDEPFTSQEIHTAELIAAQVAMQVERARLHTAAVNQLEEQRLINELGQLMSEPRSLQTVLQVAVRHLNRIVDAPNAFVMLLDEQGTRLRTVASNPPEQGEPLELPLDTPSAAAECIRLRGPLVVNQVDGDARVSNEATSRYGHHGLIALPLMMDGRPLGALVLGETRAGRRFGRAAVERAVTVANQLASAVHVARLFENLRGSLAQLAAAQEELVRRERLAALGELSAVVAHEVRNPLGVVFNSVASLRRLLGDRGGDVRMLLEILSEEAGRLDRIVSELLDFARPSALSFRLVRLEDVLRGAVEAARRTSPAPEVEVRMELPEALPELVLDAQLLHQALVNLVVNAFHAMPSGGRVTLRAALASAPPGTLRIEVEDEGPGVSADLGERIFQPFVTTKAFGTGLGLSVVRRIADAHGGRIELQAGARGGARFVLSIGLAAPG